MKHLSKVAQVIRIHKKRKSSISIKIFREISLFQGFFTAFFKSEIQKMLENDDFYVKEARYV